MICLMPHCGFLSETARILEIHRALTARGERPLTLTHGGPWVGLLREHGVDVEVIGPGWSGERTERFIAAIPGIGSPDQSMWTDEELREFVGLEAELFRRHGVDVVVTGWTLTALLSTQVAGIPLVTEHAGAFLPPLFERGRLTPPDRPLGLPLERFMPARLRTALYNKGLARRRIYTDGFNRVAAELGVPGVPSFPALLMGDLTLVTDVPEVFGVPRGVVDGWRPRPASSYRPGARMRYTGPLFTRLDVDVPPRVDAFLDTHDPVVYVALTSTPAGTVRSVVERVRATGAHVLVAATVHDLAGLEDDRVLVEPLLPSHRIMPRVVGAVITGGQGAVQTAMASGTPFVGFPLQPEQDANLDLAARQGVARRLPASRAGTVDMTDAVRAMLDDGDARTAARRVRACYAATDGPGAAAEAIMDLARDRAGARR